MSNDRNDAERGVTKVRQSWWSVVMIALMLATVPIGCGDDDEDERPMPTPTATVNQPPIIAPIGNHTVVFGSDLLIVVMATDPENDPVTLSVEDRPENAIFIPESGVFCVFGELEEQLGHPFDVTFVADDGTSESEQTVTISVVDPDPAARLALGMLENFRFEHIGDQLAMPDETLTVQLSASGVSPIRYRMFADAEIASQATLDPMTGEFHFTPTAAQAGHAYEITFQACLAEGDGCSAIVQLHEVVKVHVVLPNTSDCPSYVPMGCTQVTAPGQLPATLRGCYYIQSTGGAPWILGNTNILEKGELYFVENPDSVIDVRFKSLLVEKGGVLQAGSPACPFGKLAAMQNKAGGKLSIGLWGNDPSDENRTMNPPKGIECLTGCKVDDPMSCSTTRCFPRSRDFKPDTYYCTKKNSDDPCDEKTPPKSKCAGYPADATTSCDANFLLQDYHNLNFDPTPWGYKVLGVSYGGSLRLFGYKGAKPLQSPQWATANDSDQHCVVPDPTKSTLNAAEMHAWADLTGSSWVRLNGVNGARTVITLDRDVSADWKANDQIVVGTTDWYPSHSELRTIREVGSTMVDGATVTQLTLDRALDYPHNAKLFNTETLGVTFTENVNRKAADLRASVGLLTRSIQIRSFDKDGNDFPAVSGCIADNNPPKPECYFGGHVMIRQGFREAQMQGVEFRQLGQGGRQGHYPVHFHFAKNTAYTQDKAYVKDSSIWDSMTRFAVLHGSHGVTVARNVGYLSLGDGYFLEDGSEIENKLCHNLGVGARASLREYFVAQSKLTPLPPTARLVPPILDGALTTAVPDMNSPNRPERLTGSDTYMPVMFWFMNAFNEFVGNNAVGVHGFGSCYWLLGSGVSGPSLSTHGHGASFAGLASYNVASAYQAPLLRFRGNSCMTSPLALPASAELPPANATIATQNTVGYNAVANPYIAGKAIIKDLQGQYFRPAVNGDFKPIQPNIAGSGGGLATNCSQFAEIGTEDDTLALNPKTCVTTVIDRFSTSYNWAEVNFGSIWFRPWFYLFLNSAMTDQLFGGLTFVTAGSWIQVPPGYFSLAKNNLFVGTSQYGDGASDFAKRSGPNFKITSTDSTANFAPCAPPKITCNIEEEGTGYWRDFFQPKRLVTIYDGPHFADGNTFANIGSWRCNPQPCEGKGSCTADFECGIYSSTVQPAVKEGMNVNGKLMTVIDAAIGWKQPNGFYYPPAFAYRRSNFVKTLPNMPPAVKALNKCYSFGKEDDFKEPMDLDGSCRHNVIDRTRPYIKGNMISPNAATQLFGPGGTALPVTPVDFSTILLDLDGSLTGANGSLSGQIVETSSVSRNPFFDAPAQSPECLSFGLQTSPYQFVTTMIAPLNAAPATADNSVKPWTTLNCKNGYDDSMCPCPMPPPPTPTPTPNPVFSSPLVPIYRQWLFPGEPAQCGSVCSSTNPGSYACDRGTFMIGPDVGHATYLTMAQPQALNSSEQPGAIYYIDTNASGGVSDKTDISCITARTCVERPPTFAGGQSYVLYNLFARNDSKISYQLYVGRGATRSSIGGRYVHVLPHQHAQGSSFQSGVKDPCDPNSGSGWCKDLPQWDVDANGVLTVTIDQSKIKDDYQISKRPDYERCMPRSFCYFDGMQCRPCTKGNANCIGQAERLQTDIDALAHLDSNSENPLDVICQDWGGFASGTKTTMLGERSFVDCPASGCVGFAFTLPGDFAPKPYNEVGAPLTHCFDRTAWSQDKLVSLMKDNELVDPLCGEPRTPKPSDYCDDPGRPTATVTSTGAAGTPTSTATRPPVGPTNTMTPGSTATATRSGAATASATATQSGGATPTRTSTGAAGTPSSTPTAATPTPSATPTASVTPTPSPTGGATPTATVRPVSTATATPGGGGGFSWLVNGVAATTVNVPQAGGNYAMGQLTLVDSQNRFCTEGGRHPILRVDVGSHPLLGIFPTGNTIGQQQIAHIDGADDFRSFALLIETRVPCSSSTTVMLRFENAVTFTAQ